MARQRISSKIVKDFKNLAKERGYTYISVWITTNGYLHNISTSYNFYATKDDEKKRFNKNYSPSVTLEEIFEDLKAIL